MAPDPLDRLLPVRFGRAICGSLAEAERREWWLGNGRGGYAGGTIALSLARRYHALLVAPVDPPLGRVLVLAKADATLNMDGQSWPLFANRWASGAVAPQGHLALESFHLDGTTPVWRFSCAGRIVEHRIWMEAGADTVYAAWRLEGDSNGPAPSLRVALLANGRDHHGDTWPPGFVPQIAADGATLSVTVASRFALHVAATGGNIAARNDWYRDFDLPIERDRGLGSHDSHLHVGDAALPLAPGSWAGIAASLEPNARPDLAAALARRQQQDRAVLERAIAADPVFAAAPPWVLRLLLATDLFLISRPLAGLPEGRSVIAGYPWFGDWGRDTMISLPGLCLATGRFEEAREILETFARFVDRGMLPNVFPGAGETPEYNTADASLWYIEAWRAYVEATGDEAALRRTFPVLVEIIDWHTKGTRFGIAVDPADGLLRAGEAGVQLTWMDARVGDWVVTPRIGKPVEINALWHNALAAMAALAERIGGDGAALSRRSGKGAAGVCPFCAARRHWSLRRARRARGTRCAVAAEPALRGEPLGEPARPGGATCRRCALRRHTRHLLRIALARTGRARLLRGMPRRCPNPRRRLSPGHGLGLAARALGRLAHFRVHGDADAAQRFLEPIGDHFLDAGLGQISEIFDGEPPHTPRGCPAQAWSVACILEAWRTLEHAKAS